MCVLNNARVESRRDFREQKNPAVGVSLRHSRRCPMSPTTNDVICLRHLSVWFLFGLGRYLICCYDPTLA